MANANRVTLELMAVETLKIVMQKAQDNPEIYGRIGVDAAKAVLGYVSTEPTKKSKAQSDAKAYEDSVP